MKFNFLITKNKPGELENYYTQEGVRNIKYKPNALKIYKLRRSLKKAMGQLHRYPDGYSGKGIVICAGSLKYFTCAWVNITFLRKLGCDLPIEVWHDKNELADEIIHKLKKFKVCCKDISNYTNAKMHKYAFKPFAILHSAFEEVLYLDADNNCMVDPTFLFDSIEYRKNGAVFWPDFWKTSKKNPIWKIVQSKDFNQMEMESGQLLINKKQCWRELNLCMHFNLNTNEYYKMLNGDKDTFKFAWIALRSSFYMIQNTVGICGHRDSNNTFHGISMVQRGFKGEILFIHRNLLKWDVTGKKENLWREIKLFKQNAKQKRIQYIYNFEGHYYSLDLQGDVEIFPFKDMFGNYERKCLNVLEELRMSDFYQRFLLQTYFLKNRGKVSLAL